MSRRRHAREAVVQMLFQHDLNHDIDADSVRDMLHQRLSQDSLREFAWELYCGVMEHRAQIDERLIQIAENWRLDRMAATDRNVLRLGAYELMFSETPPRVAMDESIELAKRFGSKQSAQFVNGILDRLYNAAGGDESACGEPLADESASGETPTDESASDESLSGESDVEGEPPQGSDEEPAG